MYRSINKTENQTHLKIRHENEIIYIYQKRNKADGTENKYKEKRRFSPGSKCFNSCKNLM
uniref:Uncharacterized protein n=1 Tax=Romanomermis culicivorax TaxID=13658 RepID=A0A915HR78_ROMCU